MMGLSIVRLSNSVIMLNTVTATSHGMAFS